MTAGEGLADDFERLRCGNARPCLPWSTHDKIMIRCSRIYKFIIPDAIMDSRQRQSAILAAPNWERRAWTA